ncbi:MAG: ABC-F family ATP-binding cassette domain-containing protein [Flavobacteriales bacterium]|jgi:ATP-binding cassette subfamily F protein uup|nr:ABC-F family ATP-binding cassette domain-containing protein [Flavobacteriales bacterium]
MNLLSVENISKSFGERVLFENLSFGIAQSEKVAFVARNGTGKTTLLNLLMGKDSPNTGNIVFRKEIRVGFLEQNSQFPNEKTPMEILLDIDLPQFKTLKTYHHSLKHPEDEKLSQQALDLMQEHQAWDLEAKMEEMLFYLGLKEVAHKPVKNLSGGQIKRMALAEVLLNEPDLLILDEPTNHLDLDMIEWMQNFLLKQSFAILMVTHDRYFLDSVCNVILELEDQTIYRHKGNYSYYLEKKQEREEINAVTLGKAKQVFKKELEWMRRQPKARGTKSKSRIESFKEVKKTVKGQKKERDLQMNIQMERLGSKIIEVHHLRKSFEEKCIVDDFSYTFKKQDRIGIIGKNGVGKTTFLNLLMKLEQLDGGKIVHGETLKIGYYTQKGLQFDPNKRVIEVIKDIADVIPLAKGRKLTAAQLLERFLFPRKMQYDRVEKLSGGERKRLYLLTILMTNPNFLILDEPTNDLDILTLNVLEEFLEEFPGCLLIISHDRYFMDRLVDHLFVFQGVGKIKDFPGNYTDYRVFEEEEKKKAKAEKVPTEKKEHKKQTNRTKKLSYKEQQELKEIEKNLQKFQKEKEHIEAGLSNHDFANDELVEKSKKLHDLNNEIEELEWRWLELQEE